MDIQVYSDVVCPWCYIGKRRFARAVEQVPEASVQLRWLPFQLDPTAPDEPTPVLDAYAKKFGGVERAQQIIAQVTEVAATEGLEFNMDIAQRANTFAAHRLLWWAGTVEDGAQDRLGEQLFAAYFTQGLNIADRDTLVGLASAAELDEQQAALVIDAGRYASEVRTSIANSAAMGVSSVPTFVFNGPQSDEPFAVPGAQDSETFARLLRRLGE